MISKILCIVSLLPVAALACAQVAEDTGENTRYEGNIPAPLYYPYILAEPVFTLQEPVTPAVMFGSFKVELGKTKLSEVTRTLGGNLEHQKNRTDFLCYSAPVGSGKNRKGKDGLFQNIWLILGDKGQISQAMAEAIPPEAKKCPALPEKNSSVSFGKIRIGQRTDSLGLPTASRRNDDTGWRAWFSQKSVRNGSNIGILALRANTKKQIDRIISMDLTVKPK